MASDAAPPQGSNGSSESWSTRIGVILAVAGSAVGLGNFLRFPGQVAEYGGGAFMLAYFISFLIIGLPICWAEWTMGRFGGLHGFNSSPGILQYITRKPGFKFVGIIGVIIPVVIYMYYVYIEAWCLGYALNFLAGNMDFETVDESKAFWEGFVGMSENGAAIGLGFDQVILFLLVVFLFNFFLIYRGISKGIEWFCKYAMPALVVLALIILVRVLTLSPDASNIDNSISTGLGYLWNPTQVFQVEAVPAGEIGPDGETMDEDRVVRTQMINKGRIAEAEAAAEGNPSLTVERVGVIEQMANPQLWLAAAGQIFFTLSIGFGVIITYASYLKKEDDVVLSGLAATSANEFCEVAVGGLITIPAAVLFLGIAGVAGAGTFDLGFKVLPMVFAKMPLGELFGALFFFLLFLAAVTSSLSMLQPGIAFLEEALNIDRKVSVAMLSAVTGFGTLIVVIISEDIKVLDTLDFWIGTCMLFVLATIQIVVFSWIFGVDKGLAEANQGGTFKIPRFFRPMFQFVTPVFLIVIFVMWMLVNVFGLDMGGEEREISGYVKDLFVEPNAGAWIAIIIIGLVALFLGVIAAKSDKLKIPEA